MRAESGEIIEARFRMRPLYSAHGHTRHFRCIRERKSLMSRQKHSLYLVRLLRARLDGPLGSEGSCGAAFFLPFPPVSRRARKERYHRQNDMPIFPASATLAWKAGALLSTFPRHHHFQRRFIKKGDPGLPDLRGSLNGTDCVNVQPRAGSWPARLERMRSRRGWETRPRLG